VLSAIASIFGTGYADLSARTKSYELIENFIVDLGKYYPGKTEEHVSDLREIVSNLSGGCFGC